MSQNSDKNLDKNIKFMALSAVVLLVLFYIHCIKVVIIFNQVHTILE